MFRALSLLVLVSSALIAVAPDAEADDIRLLLDRVQVVREREASGDRPYFATIAFRSTLNRRGSTSLRVIENEPHDWVSKPAWQSPWAHHRRAVVSFLARRRPVDGPWPFRGSAT